MLHASGAVKWLPSAKGHTEVNYLPCQTQHQEGEGEREGGRWPFSSFGMLESARSREPERGSLKKPTLRPSTI